MSTWEDFELKCTDYLKEKFGQYAEYYHQGGADSTVPDILVKAKSGKSFYIEVKNCPAQCGQFVLSPDLDNHVFNYSQKNIKKINTYSKMIIEYMNNHFYDFNNAGTAGKNIEMENGSHIFSHWITKAYQEKGAKFFITNEYTLFPIEQFEDYFDVTAKYRIKKSGSTSVGQKRMGSVLNYITDHSHVFNEYYVDHNKLFIDSPDNNLHGKRFILDGTEYMFSRRGQKYEIRRLSKVNNANVIFSIKQKSSKGMSDEDFIKFLE